MSAIYIMWLRQVKKYWRSKIRIIASLGQPLLFLLVLGFGFSSIYQKAGSGNYLSFISAGVIGMSILFTATFAGIEVIWDRQFGFLKETLVAPVSRTSIMIGRTLGGATIAIIQGVIILLITLFPAMFGPACVFKRSVLASFPSKTKLRISSIYQSDFSILVIMANGFFV